MISCSLDERRYDCNQGWVICGFSVTGPLIPLRCITATGTSKNRSDTFLYLMICYFSQSKKLEHGIGLKIEPDHSTLALNEGS